MLLIKESVLSLIEKTIKHNLGFHTFKLTITTKHILSTTR